MEQALPAEALAKAGEQGAGSVEGISYLRFAICDLRFFFCLLSFIFYLDLTFRLQTFRPLDLQTFRQNVVADNTGGILFPGNTMAVADSCKEQ